MALRVDSGGVAAGIGDADVEAGRTRPTAEASPQEVRAGEPRPATPDDTSAGFSSSSDGLFHGPALLMLVLSFVVLMWTVFFFFVVSPELDEDVDDGQQHKQSCFTIVLCFYLFAIVRVMMQVKPVGRLLQAVQRGRFGSSMRPLAFVILYCPLIVFTAGSVTFCLNALYELEREDTELTRALGMFGGFSLLVAIMSCVVTIWNASLAIQARRRIQKTCRPDLLTRIPTVPYDPDLFGAEDGRRYHGECSICLGEFEAEDEISVPICGHAFHRECLGRWLRSHRTCALCRRDVTQGSEAGAEEVGSGAEVAALGARGLEEAAPGADAAAHSSAIRV